MAWRNSLVIQETRIANGTSLRGIVSKMHVAQQRPIATEKKMLGQQPRKRINSSEYWQQDVIIPGQQVIAVKRAAPWLINIRGVQIISRTPHFACSLVFQNGKRCLWEPWSTNLIRIRIRNASDRLFLSHTLSWVFLSIMYSRKEEGVKIGDFLRFVQTLYHPSVRIMLNLGGAWKALVSQPLHSSVLSAR